MFGFGFGSDGELRESKLFYWSIGAIDDACDHLQKEKGVEREVARVARGGYFGELELLSRNLRACSVWAVGQVTLARLQVVAFERLMGPCVD